MSIHNVIDNLQKYAIDVLADLIRIPTYNPPGANYLKFAERTSSILKELGFDTSIYEVPHELVIKKYPWAEKYRRYVVIGKWCEGSGYTIHFNGHYDVVPAGHGWTVTEPFQPKILDGKIFGRGAVDMKGGIAAIFTALKALKKYGFSPKGCIEVSLTPDEEVGGETGVAWMLNENLVKPDYAIIAEPSGLENVWIGNKGNVWAYIEIHGKQAHGSTPWAGCNAFEGMVLIANEIINKLKPKIESRVSKYDYGHPLGNTSTLTIGGEVKGGAKINMVPGFYSFSIDRRVIPEEDIENVITELREFINEVNEKIKNRGLKASLNIVSVAKHSLVKPDSPFVKLVSQAIKHIIGKEPNLRVCIGGLDARYFTSKGIPAVTYGPGPGDKAHMADEYVYIKDLVGVSKVYAEIIQRLLS